VVGGGGGGEIERCGGGFHGGGERGEGGLKKTKTKQVGIMACTIQKKKRRTSFRSIKSKQSGLLKEKNDLQSSTKKSQS